MIIHPAVNFDKLPVGVEVTRLTFSSAGVNAVPAAVLGSPMKTFTEANEGNEDESKNLVICPTFAA